MFVHNAHTDFSSFFHGMNIWSVGTNRRDEQRCWEQFAFNFLIWEEGDKQTYPKAGDTLLSLVIKKTCHKLARLSTFAAQGCTMWVPSKKTVRFLTPPNALDSPSDFKWVCVKWSVDGTKGWSRCPWAKKPSWKSPLTLRDSAVLSLCLFRTGSVIRNFTAIWCNLIDRWSMINDDHDHNIEVQNGSQHRCLRYGRQGAQGLIPPNADLNFEAGKFTNRLGMFKLWGRSRNNCLKVSLGKVFFICFSHPIWSSTVKFENKLSIKTFPESNWKFYEFKPESASHHVLPDGQKSRLMQAPIAGL